MNTLWELRVRSEDSKGGGGIWYFERKPTKLQCQKMFYSVAGGYEGDFPNGEKYTLRAVPNEGQHTTALPR